MYSTGASIVSWTMSLSSSRLIRTTGKDAPDPGTAHGLLMHQELEVLVEGRNGSGGLARRHDANGGRTDC